MVVDVESIFTSHEGRTIRENELDLKMSLQLLLSTEDRVLNSARLIINQIEDSAHVYLTFGLRATILEPYERGMEQSPANYQPCDIFGLVPAMTL